MYRWAWMADDAGMDITGHAAEAARRRDLDARILLAMATVTVPVGFTRDAAIDCGDIGGHKFANEPGHENGASNGDRAIAIVRGGCVVTVMFRRSTQPFTPDALHVDRCFTYRKDAS